MTIYTVSRHVASCIFLCRYNFVFIARAAAIIGILLSSATLADIDHKKALDLPFSNTATQNTQTRNENFERKKVFTPPQTITPACQCKQENSSMLELSNIASLILTLAGTVMTCAVGYLALPQEKFAYTVKMIASRKLASIISDPTLRVRSSENFRNNLIGNTSITSHSLFFHTLEGIDDITPMNFKKNGVFCRRFNKNRLYLGSRIVFFITSKESIYIGWFAVIALLITLAAGYSGMVHNHQYYVDSTLGRLSPILSVIFSTILLAELLLVGLLAFLRYTTMSATMKLAEDMGDELSASLKEGVSSKIQGAKRGG